ncbi:SoxR reducing system RseC family protein [Clostridiisalibacter paucivorans]|uniref:SoxR reducing system RseC family protein n=1 Tax=Clostridiisalibacter paucivorans TaxID=408753 RepID=UPI00047DA2C2|nr:SoxR reducing system RseC family protein [Clostridiisalibacter paucivorans]
MDQIGHVISVDGRFAEVDVRRTSSCGENCAHCGGGCSVPSIRVNIENKLNASIGDYVEIEMEAKTILKGSMILYGIPLLLLVLGIVIGNSIFQGMGYDNYEVMGFGIGILSLAVSFTILRFIDKSIQKNQSLKLEMVKIIK